MPEETQNTESKEINLDDLDAQITEMENAIDATPASVDNSTDAGTKPEEASNAYAERIEALENANSRLTEMVSRLIIVNGARISGNDNTGVEAFPSTATSVEKNFDSDPKSEIPSLSEIKLAP